MNSRRETTAIWQALPAAWVDSFAQMWIRSTWLYVDKTDYTFATAPEIVNGNVVLPIATLFQAMGCDVAWDDAADQWYGRATIVYIE